MNDNVNQYNSKTTINDSKIYLLSEIYCKVIVKRLQKFQCVLKLCYILIFGTHAGAKWFAALKL